MIVAPVETGPLPGRPSSDDLLAVGSFFSSEPSRLLRVVARLRSDDTVVESEVRGSSMAPALEAGMHIRVQLALEPQRGHVIVFLAGSQCVVHRVVRVPRRGPAREYLLARGDACRMPDPPVHQSAVVGVVTAVSRAGAWEPVPSLAPRPQFARGTSALCSAAAAVLVSVSPRAAVAILSRVRRRRWAGQP